MWLLGDYFVIPLKQAEYLVRPSSPVYQQVWNCNVTHVCFSSIQANRIKRTSSCSNSSLFVASWLASFVGRSASSGSARFLEIVNQRPSGFKLLLRYWINLEDLVLAVNRGPESSCLLRASSEIVSDICFCSCFSFSFGSVRFELLYLTPE
jgi:hypothetical protein